MMGDPVVISFGAESVSVASATLDPSGTVKGYDQGGKLVVCLDAAKVGTITVANAETDWRELSICFFNLAGANLAPTANAKAIRAAAKRLNRHAA